jgi:hypothetical protein
LGIVYARDLRQFELAEHHLEEAQPRLGRGPRLEQCNRWLQTVRDALGKSAPDQA